MVKLLVILSVLVLLGGAVYYIFFYNYNQPNVTLAMQTPQEVLVGEPFEVALDYKNASTDSLQNAKISVTLPDNVSILGDPQGVKVKEIPLGVLDPGKIGEEKVELIVLADPQTVKRITAKISYGLTSTDTTFENDAKADVVVGQPAVTLQFSAPDTVFSGEDFQIDLHYKNNSGKDFQNAKIHVDYPPIFSVSKSDPQPSQGVKNEWGLGTLAANAEGDIKINGSAIGQDGTALNYNIHFISDLNGQSYELQRQVAGVAIAKSPLSLTVQVENSSNYVAKIGDDLHYVLNYQNNSQTALKDANIKAVLSGELFNTSSLRSSGFLNSLTNTISWSAANLPELQNIPPGASGQVSFEINLLSSFPIKRLSDKNYSLKVSAEMRSPTVPSGAAATETISAALLTTKVQDELTLSSAAYYYEPTAGIKNTGPYPPRANQPTTYTVHWKLVNYANDATNVKISATLQAGTNFLSKTGGDSPVNYNYRTGEVTWEIPTVPAGKGVLSAPLEVVFQVQNTPASNQIGQNVIFLSAANLTALDSFTGVSLDDSAPALDTSLPSDTKINIDDRRVRQ